MTEAGEQLRQGLTEQSVPLWSLEMARLTHTGDPCRLCHAPHLTRAFLHLRVGFHTRPVPVPQVSSPVSSSGIGCLLPSSATPALLLLLPFKHDYLPRHLEALKGEPLFRTPWGPSIRTMSVNNNCLIQSLSSTEHFLQIHHPETLECSETNSSWALSFHG